MYRKVGFSIYGVRVIAADDGHFFWKTIPCTFGFADNPSSPLLLLSSNGLRKSDASWLVIIVDGVPILQEGVANDIEILGRFDVGARNGGEAEDTAGRQSAHEGVQSIASEQLSKL